jgi:hypothetical protein
MCQAAPCRRTWRIHTSDVSFAGTDEGILARGGHSLFSRVECLTRNWPTVRSGFAGRDCFCRARDELTLVEIWDSGEIVEGEWKSRRLESQRSEENN